MNRYADFFAVELLTNQNTANALNNADFGVKKFLRLQIPGLLIIPLVHGNSMEFFYGAESLEA